MTIERKNLGRKGEEMAAAYLRRDGYTILGQNVVLKTGEIDILAKKQNCLVIVEVKSVTGESYGPAKGYVNLRKQEKLKHLAGYLISENPTCRIRIDVIGIDFSDNQPRIEHIENAVY